MSSILLARVVESLSLVSLASFIKKMSTVIIHKRLLVIIYVITAAWLCIALVVEGIEVGAANVNVSEHNKDTWTRPVPDCDTANRLNSPRRGSGDYPRHIIRNYDTHDLDN